MRTASMLVLVAALWPVPARPDSAAEIEQQLLALERKAMDGWLRGDPDPQLAILDPDVTYIHDVVGKRLDGLSAVKEFYAPYRGAPLFDSYEILGPKVQTIGDVAVLTYQLEQRVGAATRYWNGTQVYVKRQDGWRIIHSHWSAAKDRQP